MPVSTPSNAIKPVLTAVAFRLAAALESYQAQFDHMVETWHDPETYAAVARRLDDIRTFRGALPHLSVDMVALQIAHVEVMHTLWQASLRLVAVTRSRLQPLQDAHREQVERMRGKCLRLCRTA